MSITIIGRLAQRWLAPVLILASLLPAVPSRADAAPPCQFVLGFQRFHDLLSDLVGACVGDESFDPTSGDARQQTTAGLLTWRKADNVPAFTDGANTLLDGPLGLQQRLNTCRFTWEPNPLALPLVGSADCSAAPPSQFFGVNLQPLESPYYTSYVTSDLLDGATAVGASMVRIDIHWAWLEPAGPGMDTWDPTQGALLDTFLANALQRHMQVLAVVTDTPCWALPSGPSDSAACTYDSHWNVPPVPQDFAGFLQQLVSRYKDRIHYWEIWNEPNLLPNPGPASYARLLEAAYPAVKAADPTAVVIGGALAPVNADRGTDATLAFLAGMYAAGAKGSYDALSVHVYTDGRNPLWDDHQSMLSFVGAVPRLHDAMLQAGDTSPIWITEAGWTTVSTCDPAPGACWDPTLPTTEIQQGSYLAESLALLGRWNYVAAFIWYDFIDIGAADSTAALDHFGLFHTDRRPKLSAEWLSQQAAKAH